MGREIVDGLNGEPRQATNPGRAYTAFPVVSFGVGTGSFCYVTGAAAGREPAARVGPEIISLALARVQREALDQFFRNFPSQGAA
jgi:hypothetical protein